MSVVQSHLAFVLVKAHIFITLFSAIVLVFVTTFGVISTYCQISIVYGWKIKKFPNIETLSCP